MLSRTLAILFASFLPSAALFLPMGPAHRLNALIAGTLATVLAGLSMAYDRARLGAVLIGGWVALSPFVFSSTLLEEVVTVCWGTMMFTCLAGPFSEPPRSSSSAGPETQALPEPVRELAREPAREPVRKQNLPVAA
jgi:hypothetical protein